MSACDAPLEEDSVAFRCLDAQPAVEDDELDPGLDGTPTDYCPECGNHWTLTSDEVSIFLERGSGNKILALSDKATFFFGNGDRVELRTDVDYDHSVYGRYVLRASRFIKGPPIRPGLHADPCPGKDEGVLRLEADVSTIDVRLDLWDPLESTGAPAGAAAE